MPSSKAITVPEFHDFSLVSVNERIEWDRFLPRLMLDSIVSDSALTFSRDKYERFLLTMVVTARELIKSGVKDEHTLINYFDFGSSKTNTFE